MTFALRCELFSNSSAARKKPASWSPNFKPPQKLRKSLKSNLRRSHSDPKMPSLILQIIFWITGAFWLLAAAELLRSILTLKHLPPLQSLPQPHPTLSVLIAVRSEEHTSELQVTQ